MNRLYIGIMQIILLVIVVPAKTQESWTFEAFLGSAYNFKTPLTIRQSGQDDIKLNARYDEGWLEGSPYYAWRIAKWKGNRAWELELIHHKLYLDNEPPEVQHFEISHGYNLITVNRAWKHKGLIYRLGAGVVITHPEMVIRGKELSPNQGIFNEGFYLSGPTAQAAVQKRFYIRKKLFFTVEGKLTASYAHTPIQDGYADVPNVAVHGVFGLGYEF